VSHVYNDSLFFVNYNIRFSFFHRNTKDVLTFACSPLFILAWKSDRNINYINDTENMLTKIPDGGVLCVSVSVMGLLLIVLLVDPVAVIPVVVVTWTVDDVGCGDILVVVIGVDSVTSSVNFTYTRHIYVT